MSSYDSFHKILIHVSSLNSVGRPCRRERPEAAGGVAQHRRDHKQPVEGHYVSSDFDLLLLSLRTSHASVSGTCKQIT